MSSFLPNLFADISNLPWVAIIAVSGGMLIAIVVIVGGLIVAHRRQALWHETARLALEKGQPLPQPPDEEKPATETRRDTAHRDLRAGLVLIGVGAGLFLFLDALVSRALAYVGAIPAFIGVALLVFVILTRDRSQPPADHR